MQKKLIITTNEHIYERLHKNVGTRKISKFIEDLARRYVTASHLEAGYQEMAEDRASHNQCGTPLSQ